MEKIECVHEGQSASNDLDAAARERFHAFDALRAAALLLGVVLHAASSFIPGNRSWAVIDNSTSPLMTLLVFVIHIFRLAVFFFMAGFFGIVRGAVFKDGISLGHLWFLYYLLMIYGLFLLARRLWPWRTVADRLVRASVSSAPAAAVLAIPVMAVLGFAPHPFGVPTPGRTLLPEWKPLAAYGSFFVFGWLLHRQTSLLESLKRRWVANLALAVLFSTVALAAIGKGGGRWGAGGIRQWIYAASYALAMWTWVFGLAGLFLRRFSRPSGVWRYVSDSSYFLYLAHLPLVTFLQVAAARLPWHWSVKFVFILAVSLPVLLASYDLLVRGTIAGEVLNGRRRARIIDGLKNKFRARGTGPGGRSSIPPPPPGNE